MNTSALDQLTFDQLVPSDSKYMRKDDCGEDGIILTIKGFTHEDIKGDDGPESKVVVHFVEDVRPLILNKTNSQLLAQVTGARVAGDAKGKKIVVFNDPSVSFGGKITGGLRIKRIPGPARLPQAPRAAVAPPPAREPGSDDVPFDDDVPNF